MIATAAEIQTLVREALGDYDAAIEAEPDGPHRGNLLKERWQLWHMLGFFQEYFSEAGQDWVLDRQVFRERRGGTFVEIGAFDGMTSSNTIFFERSRGWKGLLVEASPLLCGEISRNRANPVANFAVGPETGVAQFLEVSAGFRQMGGIVSSLNDRGRASIENDPNSVSEVIEVSMIGLADLLTAHGLRDIDYVSIDIEGGERAALSTFPFHDFNIHIWSIEVIQGSVADIMEPAGYRLFVHLGADQVWVKQ